MKLEVFEYIYANGGFDNKKISYKKANKAVSDCIMHLELQEYILLKATMSFYAKKANIKYKCVVCKKTKSTLSFEDNSRHCFKCRDDFLVLSKLSRQENSRRRKARVRKTSDGSITSKKLLAILEIQDHKCAECNKDLNIAKHLDHIHPIAKGGEHTIENVQYLCPKCNLTKHAKLEWKYEG